jgi:cobalt/nickel transport protein
MTRAWRFIIVAFAVALAIAAFVAPFASSAPDGLEKFAAEQGLEERAGDTAGWTRAPLPDYRVKGIRSECVATALAGVAGTLAVFGIAFGLAKVLGRRTPREEGAP